MGETLDQAEAAIYDATDPRVTSEHVRYLPTSDGAGYVVIVGVVHDHPASIFRTGHLVETLQPDVVAVELPRAAIPLFESFKSDEEGSASIGGEMSLALKRATGAKVGIDAPSLRYTRHLISYLAREGVSPILYWRVFKDLAISTYQALVTVVAAVVGNATGIWLQAHTPVEHAVTHQDSAQAQADAESEHIATREAFMQAIEVPETIHIIDTIRERVMAERIAELRGRGDVVAVVGIEHLDPVMDRIQNGV